MEDQPVVVEQLYDAPVSKVWKAITDRDEMSKWYFQLEDFKPEVGFKFHFLGGEEGGPQYLHLCEVTEVENEKTITYSWRYENLPGISYVTWDLIKEDKNKTRLRITHRGLESFAPGGAAFAKNNFVQGWTYFATDALKKYLDGRK